MTPEPTPKATPATSTDDESGVASAAFCSACAGCQWRDQGADGNWCYMFKAAPIMLPCTQHDKFKDTRDMISVVVRKRPEILTLMVMGISEPNKD